MADFIVALDCMGGDNAPEEPVKGAIDALKKDKELRVILVGDEATLRNLVQDPGEDITSRIEYLHTTEVIETAEPPVKAISRKKDSSLVQAMKLVKDEKADAFVSAGNSGAILVGGQVIIGRMPGVKRAPLAPLIPTEKGFSLLIDCGANLDSKPENLVQFALMGSIYMEHVMGKKNPTVAIVNVGAEEEKGNALVKETFPLLKAEKRINFIGSIEARDIPSGYADVIVCDAFVGNVILKLYEGVAKTIRHVLKKAFKSNVLSMLGAGLSISAIKKELKSFDTKEYGGAPMLGLNGMVVKTHGSAKAIEFKTSILQCRTFRDQRLNEIIRDNI